AAMAQQDEPQGTPGHKKKQQHQEQQAQPQQPQAQPQRAGPQRRQQRQENRAHHEQVQQQPNVNANAQAEQHINHPEKSNRQGTAAEKSTTKQTAKGETNANVAAQTNEQRTAK